MLADDRTVDLVIQRGGEKPAIREALAILLTSEQSHQCAYETIETEMIDLIYDELGRKAEPYRSLINRRLRSVLSMNWPVHAHANEILLSDSAKRLRAYLFVLAAELFHANREAAVNLSMVYELFHAALLVHDDVMDGAERRRGRDTLHRKYGVPDAIIAGDLMILKAFGLLADPIHNVADGQLRQLLAIIGETGENCCIGQSLDMRLAAERTYERVEEYLHMVEMKTGSLIDGALRGGAVLGDPRPEQVDRIANMGRNLGTAFQIINDSLDLVGKRANKSVMNDLRQAKATPMLIYALAHTGGAEKETLLRAVGNKRLGLPEAERVVNIYRQCGALAWTQTLSTTYVDRARADLHLLPNTPARHRFDEILDVLGYWGMLSDGDQKLVPASAARARSSHPALPKRGCKSGC
ncbi:MAG: polyprenyl synthetase family protein [bacterium]